MSPSRRTRIRATDADPRIERQRRDRRRVPERSRQERDKSRPDDRRLFRRHIDDRLRAPLDVEHFNRLGSVRTADRVYLRFDKLDFPLPNRLALEDYDQPDQGDEPRDSVREDADQLRDRLRQSDRIVFERPSKTALGFIEDGSIVGAYVRIEYVGGNEFRVEIVE